MTRALFTLGLRAAAAAAALAFAVVAGPIAAQTETAPAAQSDTRIVVPIRPLRAGTVLTAADLRVVQGRAGGVYVADPATAVGLETRVGLFPGRPIRISDLGPPTVVDRNANVVITFRRGGLSLRTEGRALDRGSIGDRVRVLNLDSRRTIFATVVGPSAVEAR